MTGGYVEASWSKEEIKEALELLRQGQTVYLFKREVWDHRMLRHAVESELERLQEERQHASDTT